MFSNAESIYINNKEVESIVTADGGVLYQKDSGYDLLLTCDNPILSFNDGDACTLSGVLTFNGVVVPDETIDYNIMHDGTVLDSGSLTTDDNGEINLNYIAAGVGDVDVVFSLRSLLQKTYVITDCYEIVDCSNPNDVTSQYWPIPVEITGKVKKYGTWGGTRLADENSVLIFLSQNSGNSHENEKIWYVVNNSWVDFKAIFKDGIIELYINDTLFKSVAYDTTGDVRVSAGSNANPVSLSDVKIKAL